MPKAKVEDVGIKVLLLKLSGDKETRIEVPANSKVTFGPALPGPAKAYGGPSEYAVRVYAGATEKAGLLAVFTGVREFRESSIKVSRLVVRESGKELWNSDENGYEVQRTVKKDVKMIPDAF